MNYITALIYRFVCLLISVIKLLIFWVAYLLLPLYKWKIVQLFNSIGVVIHSPESGNDIGSQVAEASKNYRKVIHVSANNKCFAKLVAYGGLAIGESYMDNDWHLQNEDDHVNNLTEMTVRSLDNNLWDHYNNFPLFKFLHWLEISAFNLQTGERAWNVGKAHYDLGNELYEVMLDPWMQYNCGYWKNASNLKESQIRKMELIAQKLDLKPGMCVLDLGCGWGTLCKYLAEKHQVSCVGVTIGKEGADYARRVCKGLPVEIRVQDYRKVDEKFDRVVCIEMLFHVGHKNHRTFFNVARRCLKDHGILLMQVIGRNHNVPRSELFGHKYVHPNANLTSVEEIAKGTKVLFVVEDWHNFGLDFATTYDVWTENFVKGWPKLSYMGERFYKMWILYLIHTTACFRTRKYQLWQIVLSKEGLRSNYRTAR